MEGSYTEKTLSAAENLSLRQYSSREGARGRDTKVNKSCFQINNRKQSSVGLSNIF